MTRPSEYNLVEKPILDTLRALGYRYLDPDTHATLRTGENEVLFQPCFVEAVARINGISRDEATAVFHDMARLEDNATWVNRLRGNYSRKVAGDDSHRTIRLVDFDDPANNDLAVTSQLRVQGAGVRKPDVVVYLNGIPVVVIEAKSPLNPGQNAWDAVDQVRSAERDVPRLFHSNLFNIATNDSTFLYAATAAPREYWLRWRDPWPRAAGEFPTPTELGLWALLEPARLLDILAHFLVFETRDGRTVKKICRYQQYRAVGKMVQRVVEGQHQQGLIWHTQGSGKSLTMVFAALKFKFHRGISAERLQNPNLLVVTDRKDLDTQITQTFEACGLPNPRRAGSMAKLQALVQPEARGLTILSTIFKFQRNTPGLDRGTHAARMDALRGLAVVGSEHWILMVDECHRTQEQELGAFLRATLPHAVRFGFTGTPVKKGDLDTFRNFGVPGEPYLDKYGIEDAVRDGATVPIYYMARKTEWHLHDKELDVLFDQWFAGEPDDVVAELKARGVTRGDLARFAPRIRLIATDIWAHYRAHLQPDGFKAQIVAIDRPACAAYKQALDKVIARSLLAQEDLDPDEAAARATAMSVCIYTPGQHDSMQHPELVKYQVDEPGEREAIANFVDPAHPLTFLIVCHKLLTGFDAPVEQAMYLDNPLTDHSLLQAIARTNRRFGAKQNGLIVDYIGVSAKLSEALAAYHSADVQNALRPTEDQADDLRAAHRAVTDFLAGFQRGRDYKADVLAVVDDHIGTEDRWYEFRALGKALLDAYAALAPDPVCLTYTDDVKFVGAVLYYGRQRFEHEEERDWRGYSEKIRRMLAEHLEVTGLTTVFKMHSIHEAAFWDDFDATGSDLDTAAVRKMTELTKITRERATQNSAQYERFSDRVKELIEQFEAGQLQAVELLKQLEDVAAGIAAEDKAHSGSGLSEGGHAIWRILQAYAPALAATDVPGAGHADIPVAAQPGAVAAPSPRDEYRTARDNLSPLQRIAEAIAELYASDQTAPPHWQEKPALRKELRARVRDLVYSFGRDAWSAIPEQVDAYAARQYAKP